jgi:lipoprotein-releasing system permease protein
VTPLVPNLKFSRYIALRYLWSRRSEAFISIISIVSVIGVALGVMVLTMVMSVMTGLQFELREKILGANSHILVRSVGGRIGNWKFFEDVIQKVPGVVSVAPYTSNQALLRTDTSATGILIRGIEPNGAAAKQLQSYLDPGTPVEEKLKLQTILAADSRDLAPSDRTQDGSESSASSAELPPLIVGRELTRSFGIYPGRAISLLSPTVSSSPFGLMPRFRRFLVSAVYHSGLVEYESGLAYTDIESAQRFFQLGDTISGYEVRVARLDGSAKVARDILTALGGTGSGFYVQDWSESNKQLWEAFRLEKQVYFIVLLLIIIMASFSIITTLVMIVLEKRRDIAVLRTLGAGSSAIANIFRIQGAVIGGLGVSLGLVSGWLGCVALQKYGFPLPEKVFQMSELPVRMEPLNFFIVGLSAFLICLLATLYPARRASALQPIDLMRHD